MKRITVLITMHFDNSKGNFEELRQKEMAHIKSWKEEDILENFYIKAEKDGAKLIFKNIEMEQVVKNIENLPLFPYMEKVVYLNFDKIFYIKKKGFRPFFYNISATFSSSCAKGCLYNRLPVALKIALAKAPPVGGNAGSPRPVGSIPLSTK